MLKTETQIRLKQDEGSNRTSSFGPKWYTIAPPHRYNFSPALTGPPICGGPPDLGDVTKELTAPATGGPLSLGGVPNSGGSLVLGHPTGKHQTEKQTIFKKTTIPPETGGPPVSGSLALEPGNVVIKQNYIRWDADILKIMNELSGTEFKVYIFCYYVDC